MNGRIDWSGLFFSAEGRASRTPFLIAAAILIVLTAVYEAVVEPQSMAALHWVTGIFVYGGLFYAGACVLAKRLHDRGKSGWWAALILFAIVMVWPAPYGVLDFLGVLVLIWAVVELAVLPGEQGSNRFGPNPRRAAAPEAVGV
ncbi:MAG TPA: DUF805 domain-containing protein [Caulobacteraceae bacterium]|nr:DUF805 domain-containing protein [Caulobacteraceae bacterium]